MSKIDLTGNQIYWLIIVGIAAFAVGWCVTFYLLRNKEESLKSLLADGNALKIVTVMFIIFATGLLAILNKFDQSVSTIFSGIVGYVLGTMRRKRDGTQGAIEGTDPSAQPPQN
jgi:ABC-type thiamin/hydroxymethylpyrimidine transport system permease subunit